jgi:hypothetical protein
MWEKFKALLTKMQITVPAEKENDLKTEIEKLTQDPNGGGDELTKLLESLKQNKGNDQTSKVVEALAAQVSVLVEQNKNLTTLLSEEKTNRENAIKTQADADKAAKAKKVNDAIEKAFTEKKIVEADKPLWKTRLEKDYEEWFKELDAKPVAKHLEKPNQQQQQQQQTQTSQNQSTGNSILDSIASHNSNAVLPELK